MACQTTAGKPQENTVAQLPAAAVTADDMKATVRGLELICEAGGSGSVPMVGMLKVEKVSETDGCSSSGLSGWKIQVEASPGKVIGKASFDGDGRFVNGSRLNAEGEFVQIDGNTARSWIALAAFYPSSTEEENQ